MHYLKSNGCLAVGTHIGNRNKGCSLMANKNFSKQEKGSVDYQVDNNSGLIVVKWLDKDKEAESINGMDRPSEGL